MKKTNFKRNLIGMIYLMFLFLLCFPTEIKAADSYTDAKVFYYSCKDDKYHIEYADQSIYYATKAKQAKNTSNLRYATLCNLASRNNPTAWSYIEKSSSISIQMDAIVSWLNPGETQTAGLWRGL